jgi:hypothetical protein
MGDGTRDKGEVGMALFELVCLRIAFGHAE